jgi:hypothetical protein
MINIDEKLYVTAAWGPILQRSGFTDPATNTWDTTRAACPRPANMRRPPVFDGKLYVIGGEARHV